MCMHILWDLNVDFKLFDIALYLAKCFFVSFIRTSLGYMVFVFFRNPQTMFPHIIQFLSDVLLTHIIFFL